MSDRAPCMLVDWGTTNLRAFLVAGDGGVLERQVSDQGILKVGPEDMPGILDSLAAPWSDRIGERPILLCGMVGSANGWSEVPYVSCPAGFGDLPKNAKEVRSAAGRAAVILPGLTRQRQLAGGLLQADVMRGEETQIFGALNLLGREAATFCLPGTHAKWARAEDGRCVDFATYFTGELYSVLSRHSLLGRLFEETGGSARSSVPGEIPEGFERGLAMANATEGLSGALFSTRADILTRLMTSAQGAGYLSGLLIGYEIREALPRFAPAAVPGIGAPGTGVAGSGVAGPEGAIVVVGAHALVPLYQAALTRAGANVVPLDGDAAVVAGLLLASRML